MFKAITERLPWKEISLDLTLTGALKAHLLIPKTEKSLLTHGT